MHTENVALVLDYERCKASTKSAGLKEYSTNITLRVDERFENYYQPWQIENTVIVS